MRSIIRSGFFWQFSGGFVLGALGLLAIQPADARHMLASHIERVVHPQR